MKLLIIALAFIIITPLFGSAQFIKSNQTDAFTHQKRIVTNETNVEADISFNSGVKSISFNTINDSLYIVLHGNQTVARLAGSILPTDIALLITEKDTIVVRSTGMQTAYGKGVATSFDHQYHISEDGLNKLATSHLLLIKRYTSEGIFDTSVKDRFQDKLMRLAVALLKEMHE